MSRFDFIKNMKEKSKIVSCKTLENVTRQQCVTSHYLAGNAGVRISPSILTAAFLSLLLFYK